MPIVGFRGVRSTTLTLRVRVPGVWVVDSVASGLGSLGFRFRGLEIRVRRATTESGYV